MAEPTDKEKAAAAQAQATAAQSSEKQSSAKPAGEPINSANKSADEAQLQAAAAVPGSPAATEVAARGVELDHGEPDPAVKARVEAQEKALKDPWGTTPLQMRDSHDEAVDPAKVGVATRPDGTGLVVPEGERPEAQGTLPPLG